MEAPLLSREGRPVWTNMEATVLDAERTQPTFTQQTLLNTFNRPVLEIKSVRLPAGRGNLWLQCIQEPRTGLPSFRKQGCGLYSIWLATAQTNKAGMGATGKKGVTQKVAFRWVWKDKSNFARHRKKKKNPQNQEIKINWNIRPAN